MALDRALEPHVPADPVEPWPRRKVRSRRRSRSGSAIASRTRELLDAGADPCERVRRHGRRRATSGSNSSATGCSALPSPKCCSSAFPMRREGELSRRLVGTRAPRDLRRGRARPGTSGPICGSAPARCSRAGGATRRSWPTSARRSSARSSSTAAMSGAKALVERAFGERLLGAAAPAARPQERAAGMGAGARAADADLLGRRAGGPDHAPQFRVDGRGRRASSASSARRVEARRRTGRRPQPPPAGGRVDGGRPMACA